MWRWLLGIVIVVSVAGGIVIGALNPEPVAVDLALFQWAAPAGIVIVVACAAGFALGVIVAALALLLRRPRSRSAGGSASLPDA
ncbi:MAG: LapA family protein [Candidatus Wenzhouxiangella sp. M2_3B_020]